MDAPDVTEIIRAIECSFIGNFKIFSIQSEQGVIFEETKKQALFFVFFFKEEKGAEEK